MKQFIQSITYTPEALNKIANSRFFEFLANEGPHSPDLLNELTFISDSLTLGQFLNFVYELDKFFASSKDIVQGVTFDASSMTFINELIANADNWHK